VLFFAYAYPPAQSAGIFRTLRFVRYLRDFGWTPLVLTARPESLHHKRFDPALDDWTPIGTVVERTAVLRPVSRALDKLKTASARIGAHPAAITSPGRSINSSSSIANKPGRRSRFRRMLALVEESLSTPDGQIGWTLPAIQAALRMIRKHRPKVLYSTGPPHSSHLIALLVKVLTGIPLVIDFRDPWARCEWLSEPAKVRDCVNPWLERICVTQSDFVILNTAALREQLCHAYDKTLHSKFAVLPNGYDPALRDRAEALLEADAHSPNGVRLRLCHPGTVYGRRNLRPLIDAIGLLKESQDKVALEQVGLVDADQELANEIQSRHLSDVVTLLGRQPHDVTLQRMAAADAFVLIQPDTSVQVPGKLYEMLPFRKPILAITGKGETADLITDYRLGVVASPGSHEHIAAAIQRLAQLIEAEYDFGWQKALEVFEGRKLTGDLAAILNRVTGCRN
jgi:glycosyltransferase involved in cell wall biosynthesis